jgi:ribosomal protein L37AE/L43A
MSSDRSVFGRLRRMFGPACPECGRRTTKPETPSSPIWVCATCGLRYLPSPVGATPARSTNVTPFRRR